MKIRPFLRIPSLALLLTAAFSAPLLAQEATSEPIVRANDIVAICGDSITEQRLYSLFIENYLQMCQPEQPITAVQFGWGGAQANQLWQRWENEINPFKPTIVTTSYGMNDGRYQPITEEVEKTYRENLTRGVKQLKENGVREILVGSPGVVDSEYFKRIPADVYNATLGRLSQIAKEVAESEKVGYVDVHSVGMEVMKKAKEKNGEKYAVWGTDGVHPQRNGQLVMAYAYLKGLGMDGDVGTITLDAASGKAEATDGHSIVSAAPTVVEVESVRYPFCFEGDPKSPDATTGIIEFFPFNEDLNRYVLKVNNLSAPKAKVTWGKESKEFTKEQLAEGVNLAAEFLDNPFVPAFKKVQNAVSQKQAFEVSFIKQFLSNHAKFAEQFKTAKPELDALREKITAEHAELQQNIKDARETVRHKIEIEPLAG